MAIETVELTTLDGVRLAADIAIHPGAAACAVVCHPHPLYGGDRRSPVVDTVFRALDADGVMTVRFDFRGAGDSEGSHGGGTDERLDVAAAIDWLALVSEAPLWLVGYSFGAAVALDVVHPRVEGWVAVAPPLAAMPGDRLAATDHRPVHVVLAGHDQFGTPDQVQPLLERWSNTAVTVVPTADHFFAGHLAPVAAMVTDVVSGPRRR